MTLRPSRLAAATVASTARAPRRPPAGCALMRLAMLALPAMLACGAAQATRGADVPPPTPEAVRAAHSESASRAAREQAADASLTVREGRITAVDAAAGRVEIDGTAFRLVDGRSRIYRRGASVAATALSRGEPVAFAVSPAERDTVAVIHVR